MNLDHFYLTGNDSTPTCVKCTYSTQFCTQFKQYYNRNTADFFHEKSIFSLIFLTENFNENNQEPLNYDPRNSPQDWLPFHPLCNYILNALSFTCLGYIRSSLKVPALVSRWIVLEPVLICFTLTMQT